jgi:hypothetical protein
MVWEKEVQDFVSARLTGFCINVPCGSSMLGTVRVDMDPAMNPDRVADMNDLPFENGTFDSGVQDPIWKLNYYARMRPFFELIRVVKVNGIIIYNAPWIPTSKAVELQDTWIRRSAQFGNVSIISVFQKTTDKYDVEQAIRALDPLPALEEAPGDRLPRIPGQCRDQLAVVM